MSYFKYKVQDPTDTAIIYQKNTFGIFVAGILMEKEGFKELYSYEIDSDIQQITTSAKNIIHIGDKNIQIYNVLYNEDRKFYFYDTFPIQTTKPENVYFSLFEGKLTIDNKYRAPFFEKYISIVGKEPEIYDLLLVDIVNALSYITVATRQKNSDMVNIISSYGKYSGNISFNNDGDRDKDFYVISRYNPTLRDIISVIDVKGFIENIDKVSYIFNNSDTNYKRYIITNINTEIINWSKVTVIDAIGLTKVITQSNLSPIKTIESAITETVVLEHPTYIMYVYPTLDITTRFKVCILDRRYNLWYEDSYLYNDQFYIFNLRQLTPLEIKKLTIGTAIVKYDINVLRTIVRDFNAALNSGSLRQVLNTYNTYQETILQYDDVVYVGNLIVTQLLRNISFQDFDINVFSKSLYDFVYESGSNIDNAILSFINAIINFVQIKESSLLKYQNILYELNFTKNRIISLL